ncbi:MAG: ABC transporter substrate-binding protein [Acidimicrobiales bacterium]
MGDRSVSSRRLRLGAVVVVVAMAVIAAACGSGSSSSAPDAPATTVPDEGMPTSGGVLKVGITADQNGYDASSARWDPVGNLVDSTIYDSLMKFDADRKLQPNLAQSVTSNADGTVWTITMRPGVTFQDGTPADAAAVKLNIDTRKADPLAGAALDPVQEVRVTGPLTTEVQMKQPWFGYDATLAAQGGYLVAPATINDKSDDAKPIGTGPFAFKSWSKGNSFEVVKNASYWQSGKPYLDGIVFTIVPDQTALMAAIRAGNVDLVMTDDATSIKTLRSSSDLRSIEDVNAETAYVQMNEAVAPFDNIHARKALAYATDQQTLIDSVGQGIGLQADSPYTEDSQWHVADAKYVTFDTEQAKAELAAYTADTGQSKLSFTLKLSSGGAFPQVAVALQAQWAAAGIDAQIGELEQATFLADSFLGNYQASIFRNFGYVNPDSNYLFWSSTTAKGVGTGSINFTQTKVPAIDEGLDGARASSDDAKRKVYYDQVQQALNGELPYVWLYHVVWALGARPDVGGLSEPQSLGFGRTDAKPWWTDIWLKS